MSKAAATLTLTAMGFVFELLGGQYAFQLKSLIATSVLKTEVQARHKQCDLLVLTYIASTN
jgi:hypothetical protein